MKSGEKKQQLFDKRNRDLFKRWNELNGVTEGGVQKFSQEYILKKLEDQFYLDEDYIMKLVRKQSIKESDEAAALKSKQGQLF